MTRRAVALVRCRGFTLLEMLVTLMLLGFTATLFFPAVLSGPGAAGLGSDVRILASRLRAAREAALSSRSPAAITLDLVVPAVSGPDGQETYRFSAVQSLDVRTARGLAAGPAEQIVFQPDGGSTGGTVTLRAGALTRSVDVNWLTGTVTIDGPAG